MNQPGVERELLCTSAPMPSAYSGREPHQQSGCEVINLDSDEPIVLMDAIRLVEELVGKRANIEYKPRHPADVLATWADIGKAERLLALRPGSGQGWRPQVAFAEGVEQLVTWYRDNRAWAKDVATR